jgi:hypothetical protein
MEKKPAWAFFGIPKDPSNRENSKSQLNILN